MGYDWLAIIPWVGPDANLIGFLNTMGTPQVSVLILDNSPDSGTKRMTLPPMVEVEHHPYNLGIAPSYNRGFIRGHYQNLILSSSVRFGPGGLAAIIDEADKHADNYGLQIAGLPGNHITVIGRATIDAIGLWDENFWPYEAEDMDYGMRMCYAGIAFSHPKATVTHTHPLWAPEAGMLYDAGVSVATKAGCLKPFGWASFRSVDYFVRKWGSREQSQQYTRPFGEQSNPLSYWPDPRIYWPELFNVVDPYVDPSGRRVVLDRRNRWDGCPFQYRDYWPEIVR